MSARPETSRARVVNKRSGEPYDVYVGRPSKWGNPFVIGRDGTRAEVIEKYERWLCRSGLDVQELEGKVLACWCAPEPCHADVLAAYANAMTRLRVRVLADASPCAPARTGDA